MNNSDKLVIPEFKGKPGKEEEAESKPEKPPVSAASLSGLYNGLYLYNFCKAVMDEALENGIINEGQYHQTMMLYDRQRDDIELELEKRDKVVPVIPDIKIAKKVNPNKPPRTVIHVKAATLGAKTK